MRFRVLAIFITLVVVATATVSAQFGHPLKGTWSGEWGPTKEHIVLNMNWDGKQVSSTLNPGANAVTMKTVTLDPATWAVHMEGDGKDKSGSSVHYVIDGKVDNIGAYQRFMTGTMTVGNRKGDFKVVRN